MTPMQPFNPAEAQTERYSSSVPPYRFIDRSFRCGPTTFQAIKSITRNEWCLVQVGCKGWIFPQTLLLESMAQTAGTFDEIIQDRIPPKKIYVVRIRDIRFLKDPHPGDVLVMEAELLKDMGNQAAYEVRVSINQETVAEATFYFSRM